MDIKKAKQQIVDSVKAYLATDEYGRYLIPKHKQRPLFLMGPPGIGKTEIMMQTASELGIGLVSYSMTHHTRQSALGLPIIKHKEYFGREYDISEYTMSEIIAKVYDTMTVSGIKCGILFLDEINCISETLTPVMLQFLQYKVFGGHELPEGWVVVTAGNPPEYNDSVREFDIATWDRLKRIDIEPSLDVWREYAYSEGVHAAVLTYLEIKPRHFYKIETTVNGKRFVTARGWDDLSRMLNVYEICGMEADKNLISQYIQNDNIASDFAAYYELYKKYKSDYKIKKILSGEVSDKIIKRASSARFDERYSLIGLLLETIGNETKSVLRCENVLTQVHKMLKEMKLSSISTEKYLEDAIGEEKKKYDDLKAANSLSYENDTYYTMLLSMLGGYKEAACEGMEAVSEIYADDVSDYKKLMLGTKDMYSNMFAFCEKAFGSDSQEILILVTELAANPFTARFISSFGCEEYHKYDKALMFYERRNEILNELDRLDSDKPK